MVIVVDVDVCLLDLCRNWFGVLLLSYAYLCLLISLVVALLSWLRELISLVYCVRILFCYLVLILFLGVPDYFAAGSLWLVFIVVCGGIVVDFVCLRLLLLCICVICLLICLGVMGV